MPPRSIVHLDADAFFASVEQAADPRLRGKPVAVGGDKRGIVASASYEARRFGIYAPMPTARARRLCSKLIVLPGDFEKYERFSRWMFSYAYDFTPDVEIGGMDEGYFDLTGARQPPVAIATTIRDAIRQALKIVVSEGIGSNKLVSQIASKLNKPAAFREVPAGREREFLHPLPNRWLPGVGPKTGDRLDAAGLALIQQIAATPAELLSLLVGNAAPQLKQFANGVDDRPVVPERSPAKSYSRQETFAQDQTDGDFIEATLRRMADDLMAAVREEQKSIRTVTLKIRYNDMAEDQCSESLVEPTDLETDIHPRLRPMLRQAWRRRVSLRMVSLKFSNVYNGFFRAELPLETSARQHEARRRLAAAMDELRTTRGHRAVFRGHEFALGTSKVELVAPRRNTQYAIRHTVSPYVPLHVHSHYSFLDSTLSVAAIIELAQRHGLPAIALTDRGNLHGAVEFSLAARAAGIQPIIGAEIEAGGRPLRLYVQNAAGYKNLCRVLSGEPLAGAEDGLLALSPDPRFAPQFPGRFYLEISGRPAARDLPCVASVPIHYAAPADRWKYDIVQSIRTRTLLRQEHPQKHLAGEFHFRPPREMQALVGDEPSLLVRTLEIAERCTFELSPAKPQFPVFAPPDGSTPRDFLRRLVLGSLRRRYPARHAALRPQVEQELAIIHEVGYEEYFLAVWDLLQDCRRRGIEWITRGSAADSLVCYCLEISDVCPIRFDLYFRRFLNQERMALNKLPDIDVDFAHDRKDDVVDLIFAKYGAAHTAVVGGFSTFQARSAFAEVAKVLGVPEHQVRRITERLPCARARDLEAAVAARPECRDLPLDEELYRSALRMAAFLDGFPRHPKMHPCGVVLSREPMRELTPTFVSGKGWPTTHFDMDAVEAIGLVKMDILAQGGLAVLRDARAMLAARGVHADLRALEPWEDPAVWDMIARGEARAVHHIESPAMISLCRQCNVRDIDTLVAIVSVIRPGAANENKKREFTRRYQGLAPVACPHPSLEPCLRGTFGLVVYEEHILQICEAFAGLPPGRADVLRRALVKEKQDVIATIAKEFAACARARGRTEPEIAAVWELVAGFHGYAFCKAHSTAYGVEAYQSAWLKKYFPAEFMAAVLTAGKGFYRPLVYALECHRLGIPLLPPWINEPGPGFQVVRSPSSKIRVPVARIKGLTARTLDAILAGRARGVFESLADFHRRVRPSAEEMETLSRAGAFDGFGQSRTAQFWEIQRLQRSAGGPPEQLLRDQPTACPAVTFPLREPDRRQRLRWEDELLGFTASGHPLELYDDIAWETYCPVSRLGAHVGEVVVTCGLVIEDRVHHQITGEPMKFLTLADRTGIIETELFARTYKTCGLATVRYPVLEITAKVEPFENGRGHTLRVLRAGKPRQAPSRGHSQRASSP